MRSLLTIMLLTTLPLLGCGQKTGDEAVTDLAPPTGADQTTDTGPSNMMGAMMGGDTHDMGIKTDISMSDEIKNAWAGAIIQVAGPQGTPQRYELIIGEEVDLGDTGLTATALIFIPDFVMGEDGITSRSPEPTNPALRLRITENDRPDYEGWLFGAMPEIPPFPHETYSILLAEGIPAE